MHVVDIKPVCRADNGMGNCLGILLVKQYLTAPKHSKGMGSRHHLAKASQVIHTITTTDGIIHQQAVVGKVVFVHGLKDSRE